MKLQQDLQRDPSTEELSAALEITLKKTNDLLAASHHHDSLDFHGGENND